MTKDYYTILGVQKNATKDDVKKAYKNLAKRYHPDVNNNPDAESKFKEINEAFSVIGDDQKRSQYDQFGTVDPRGQGDFGANNFGGDFDFTDIFESFFGGSGTKAKGRRVYKGEDLRYEMEITLEDAAFGADKTIELRKNEQCKECHGKGGSNPAKCPVCNGIGMVREQRRTPFGIFQSQAACSECQGSGELFEDICLTCRGSGIMKTKKQIEIKIPAGIEEGNHIRLTGEGEPGRFGGPPGDLYVRMIISPHTYFTRQGHDILIDVPISFTQAVFGDEITVPTLQGEAKLIIPEGTQTGTVFSLKNKGIPYLQTTKVGNQLVKVYVTVPKNINKAQEKILKEFSQAMGEKNTRPQKSFFSSIFK
jgi:molecular chaperone DnaJ